MRAAVVERFGGPEVVAVRDVPEPRPASGQVRVRVRASSLNPIDSRLRSGWMRHFFRLKRPIVLGFDLAGEIESLAPGVSGFAIGDRVYGRIQGMGGAHAEMARVSTSVLDRIPDRLPFERAAALPLVAMTALQALRDVAKVRQGHRLLVIGAAGGVGSHAIQIGRALGAHVTAVVRSHGAELALALGAAEVWTEAEIDRRQRRFDAIFDTVFVPDFPKLLRLLAPRGVYVTTNFSPALGLRMLLWPLSGRRAAFLISRAGRDLMRALGEMVSKGQLEPVIDSVFPLDRIREAYEKLETGHPRGKIVLGIP